MHTKDFRAAVKAAGPADGLGDGEFRAVVSVFGNVDSVGDVVMPGAFKADLARWAASGDPIPVIWSHDWADPMSHVGTVIEAKETAAGLEVRARIDDLADNAKAAQVYRLLKGRRVTQFSFAYDIEDGAPAERDGREVYELRRLKVHEVGPCLLGANQETTLLAAKADRVRRDAVAGRRPSALAVASLREAKDAITAALAAADAAPEVDPEDDLDEAAPDTPDTPSTGGPGDDAETPPATPVPDTETTPDATAPGVHDPDPTGPGVTEESTSQRVEPPADEDPDGDRRGKSGPVATPRARRASAVVIAMQMS